MSCFWAQQSFYWKTKTFSDGHFQSTCKVWDLQCFYYNKPQSKFFSLFQLVCQKIKILHKIKFNQEILTKLLKGMHQLSISLLCSSDYQTTHSFCEIKQFFKQAKSLWIHFQELLLKNITFKTSYEPFYRKGIVWIGLNRTDLSCWQFIFLYQAFLYPHLIYQGGGGRPDPLLSQNRCPMNENTNIQIATKFTILKITSQNVSREWPYYYLFQKYNFGVGGKARF